MGLAKERTGLRRYMVMPMKTSLATTISIAGVVAAGAFTLAVNSSMLNSVSTSTDIAAVDPSVLVAGSTELTTAGKCPYDHRASGASSSFQLQHSRRSLGSTRSIS